MQHIEIIRYTSVKCQIFYTKIEIPTFVFFIEASVKKIILFVAESSIAQKSTNKIIFQIISLYAKFAEKSINI